MQPRSHNFFFRSRHFPSFFVRLFKNSSFFEIGGFINAFKYTISTRAFILLKSAGTKMMLFATLMHSFGQP